MFFAPSLRLLHELGPGHSYYQGGGKAGEMLPLFRWGWASVDHVVPVVSGGTNDDSNLVAACWKCNLRKGDRKVERSRQLQDIPQELADLDWDGFSSLYPRLARQSDEWIRLILPEELP